MFSLCYCLDFGIFDKVKAPRLFTYCCLVFCLLHVRLVSSQVNNFIKIDAQIRNFGFDIGAGLYKTNDFDNLGLAYGVKIGPINHPKEIPVINTGLPGSSSFKLEKINYTWALRPFIQKSIYLTKRKSRFQVAYSIDYGGSINAAYNWPVYIWLYQGRAPFDGYANVRYDPSVHDPNLIGGSSSFSRGFKEGEIIWGLGCFAAVTVEWGSYRSLKNSLSLGVSNDIYMRKLPILYDESLNRFNFPALFVNFAVGFGSDQ